MLDKITSVFDNYNGKIRNPFIGTIISVWLIHNWRIPFAIFNFDDDCTMQDKINYIADYFGKQDFWWEIGKIIFFSFLILVFTFILMAISRFLTDSYYKILEKFLITFIDKNAIYTIDDKIKLDNKIIELEQILNSKREEVTRTETNNSYMQISRDKIKQEFDEFKNSSSQELQRIKDDYEILESKSKDAKKVINRFDEIIQNFSSIDKSIVESKIKENDFLNSLKLSPELINIFQSHGFVIRNENKFLLNTIGILFLEYYKSNELPF